MSDNLREALVNMGLATKEQVQEIEKSKNAEKKSQNKYYTNNKKEELKYLL